MNKINGDTSLILESIKNNLAKGVINRDHGFHAPIFTNILENSDAASRIVILRKFDARNWIINFHTDIRSKKINSLKKKSSTNFLFYDNQLKFQLRIKSKSTIQYNNSISKYAWENTSLMSRKCYLTKKPPSSVTSISEDGLPKHLTGKEPNKKESENGYINFAVITNLIENIDWLHLASHGHQRLKINLKDGISKVSFKWIIP